MVKILILLLLCCGWVNSCANHKSNKTTNNAIKWEICCININSGAPYNCIADQRSDTIDCGTDNQYVELVCLKDTSNPCNITFEMSSLVIEYKGNTHYLPMINPNIFLMIQRNIVEKNQDFFNKDLQVMKKTIFTPVNINPVGNFWLGLDLIHNLTTNPHFDTNLQIRVNHTVKSDKFVLNYNLIRVSSESESYGLTLDGFSVYHDNEGLNIKNNFWASGYYYSDVHDFPIPFQGLDYYCVSMQKGAWWLDASCNSGNLNSDDGKNGWEYSYDDPTKEITGSLMGINFFPRPVS